MSDCASPPKHWITAPSRPHPFELCIPQTALLIIDMQKDFCHPDGYAGAVLGADLTAVQAIVPKIQALIAWARDQDILIIFSRESHRSDCSDLSLSKKVRYQNAGYPVGS